MTIPHRTVLRGGTVLTMTPGESPFVGDVVVDGTSITAVGPGAADGPGDHAPDTVVDATGCIVLPGFVDTHRHMWEALLRGSEPRTTLREYLTSFGTGIAARVSPRDVYLGTALSARAAQLSGITTVQDVANIQDSPAHTDASLEALTGSGSRAVFAYGASIARIAARGPALPADVRRARRAVESSAGPLVTMALVTEWGDDEVERANAALADELDVRTARHLSAAFPVARLRALGVLRPGTTVIHGNGYDRTALGVIADAGATLSVAPAIEQVMGHGTPLVGRTPPGLQVSLSSDVEIACSADVFTQMRAAYQSSRAQQLAAGEATGLTVRDVLELATRGGAIALGLADQVGTIAVGTQADLVVLRADGPDVVPVLDPFSTVVLQMDRSHVDTVLVAGRPVVGPHAPTCSAPVAEAVDAARRLAREHDEPVRGGGR